jgi:predicted dienelactone hydrolase
MFGLPALHQVLLAAALTFHAGQQPFSFTAQQIAAQAGVPSATVHGIIWYPAGTDALEKPQPIAAQGGARFIAGRAAPGAPIATAPKAFPLVLLSHGTGGSAAQMAWLGTALARAGFIAVAIDHPGNNSIGEKTVEGFTLWWLRARELSMALDTIVDDPILGPRVDQTRIGAAGFALGGYAVIALAGGRVDFSKLLAICANGATGAGACPSPPEFPDLTDKMQALRAGDASYANLLANSNVSVADPRVRAVYALAPVVGGAVTLASLRAINVPTRIAYGAADTTASPAANALYYAGAIPGSTLLLVAKAAHYTFLNVCTAIGLQTRPAVCVDAAGVDREAVHAQVGGDAVDFFERALAP